MPEKKLLNFPLNSYVSFPNPGPMTYNVSSVGDVFGVATAEPKMWRSPSALLAREAPTLCYMT